MTSAETQRWVELGMIAIAGYLVYTTIKGIGNGIGSAAQAALNAGQNLDANLGLTNFDQSVSNLFSNPNPGS